MDHEYDMDHEYEYIYNISFHGDKCYFDIYLQLNNVLARSSELAGDKTLLDKFIDVNMRHDIITDSFDVVGLPDWITTHLHANAILEGIIIS